MLKIYIFFLIILYQEQQEFMQTDNSETEW